MINCTAMDSTGVYHLEIVQQFFKKMKVPLDQVKIEGTYFDLTTQHNQTRILLFHLIILYNL